MSVREVQRDPERADGRGKSVVLSGEQTELDQLRLGEVTGECLPCLRRHPPGDDELVGGGYQHPLPVGEPFGIGPLENPGLQLCVQTTAAGQSAMLLPLARALNAALDLDAERRKSMAQVAIRHVRENFTLDKMCDSTLAVYREVLAGEPPAESDR